MLARIVNGVNMHCFWLDYVNGCRYATPCIVVGSFISVVALIIALAGPCSSPDRTLVCSSLHILAGTINFERYNMCMTPRHKNEIKNKIDGDRILFACFEAIQK